MSDIIIDNSGMEYQKVNIPLTEMNRVSELNAEDLLLISRCENEQYDTKTITYRNFSYDISSDLDLSGLRELIISASEMILDNNGEITSVGENDEPHIIQGIQENNFGRISDISSISLKAAMEKILNTNIFNIISATNSPWILSNNITDEMGDSTTKVASQKLAKCLSDDVFNNYVKKSDIVNDVNGQSSDKVASQNLINSLSDTVKNDFITNSRIKKELTSINDTEDVLSTNVASIGIIKELSGIVNDNYIRKTQIVNTLTQSPSTTNIASEKLVYDLSNNISETYLQTNTMESYIPLSNITDDIGNGDSTKVASQKLAKGLSDEIDRRLPSGRDGEVYFATKGTITKKTLMDLNVFVCEDEADLSVVENFPYIDSDITRNMFADWEIGSYHEEKWYGYDNDFKKDLTDKGYSNWERLSSTPKILQQKVNTTDQAFCVTPYAIDKFDITLSVKSTNNDNDSFGFVASYIEDETGKPHTLTFVCHGGDNNISLKGYNFGCVYDNTNIVKTKLFTAANWSSSRIVLLRVIRDKNRLSAITCTPSTNPTLNDDDSKYKIEIDLDAPEIISPSLTSNVVEIDDTIVDKLSVFKDKPGKIGVYNYSQPNTFYTFEQFNTERIIIRSDTDEIYSYYKDDSTSTPIITQIDKSPQDYIGAGRFTKNLITNKTFYLTPTGFIKVSEL